MYTRRLTKVLDLSSCEKVDSFLIRQLLKKKKRRTIPHENAPFAEHEFSCKRDIQPIFKTYTKKGVLSIYRMVYKSLVCSFAKFVVYDSILIDRFYGFCAVRTNA